MSETNSKPQPEAGIKTICFEARVYCSPQKVTQVVTIDAVDSHLLKHAWGISRLGYVVRIAPVEGKTKNFYLHREIIGFVVLGLTIDHIDCDRLNNTRGNLRVCTHGENCRNRLPILGRSSRYKGVGFTNSNGKWRAQIMLDGKNIHLGYHLSELDAAIAYNEACLKYHGEFGRPNVLAEGV